MSKERPILFSAPMVRAILEGRKTVIRGDDVSPNYRDWYPAAWRYLWESTGGDWASNP